MDELCDACGAEVDAEDLYLGNVGHICEDCYYREQEEQQEEDGILD